MRLNEIEKKKQQLIFVFGSQMPRTEHMSIERFSFKLKTQERIIVRILSWLKLY